MARFQAVCLVSSDSTITDVEIERAILESMDVEVILAVAGTEAATLAATRDADAILHRGGRLSSCVIQDLVRCRVVAHGGVGYDSLDTAVATARGIIVTNVADYCVDEVSDHALLFLLSLGKRLMPQTQSTRTGRWTPQGAGTVRRLRDSTVAVVGYGRIGSAFGRKARQLGLRVLAVDPYLDPVHLRDHGAVPCELHPALREADFVSVHAPLNASTHHLIGIDELRLMKPSAYLINTARGGIVDERALLQALNANWIAGTAVDVLEYEPPDPTHPFLQMDNVIVTPHAAYYSEASIVEVRQTMAQQISDVLSGRWPRFVVNPDVQRLVTFAPEPPC